MADNCQKHLAPYILFVLMQEVQSRWTVQPAVVTGHTEGTLTAPTTAVSPHTFVFVEVTDHLHCWLRVFLVAIQTLQLVWAEQEVAVAEHCVLEQLVDPVTHESEQYCKPVLAFPQVHFTPCGFAFCRHKAQVLWIEHVVVKGHCVLEQLIDPPIQVSWQLWTPVVEVLQVHFTPTELRELRQVVHVVLPVHALVVTAAHCVLEQAVDPVIQVFWQDWAPVLEVAQVHLTPALLRLLVHVVQVVLAVHVVVAAVVMTVVAVVAGHCVCEQAAEPGIQLFWQLVAPVEAVVQVHLTPEGFKVLIQVEHAILVVH